MQKNTQNTEFWQQAIGAMIPMFNAPPKSIVDIVGNYDLKAARLFGDWWSEQDWTLFAQC